MSEKIAIIGGDSPFVPSLIEAILENKEVLNGSEVSLMDINPDRLPILICYKSRNTCYDYTNNCNCIHSLLKCFIAFESI